MINALGRKLGMTQIFRPDGRLLPVTVVDVAHWYVVGYKTEARDGYVAVQVGMPRKRYQASEFSVEWLKNTQKFFYEIKEVAPYGEELPAVGSVATFSALFQEGEKIDAFGTTKGRGFQGVVKRHDFKGGPASHGPRLGRIPGSIGNHRSQGKVAKGKKLPGHMGVDRRGMLNLEIIKVEADRNVIFIKGSMPGHAGSLVFLRKSVREL